MVFYCTESISNCERIFSFFFIITFLFSISHWPKQGALLQISIILLGLMKFVKIYIKWFSYNNIMLYLALIFDATLDDCECFLVDVNTRLWPRSNWFNLNAFYKIHFKYKIFILNFFSYIRFFNLRLNSYRHYKT